MIITLIGMMGVGKTTVGKALSREINWYYYDIDKIISKRTGRCIPEIFSRGGNIVFRNWERKVISELYSKISSGVVAAGGGAVLSPQNRKFFMNSGPVFYLAAEIEEIMARIDVKNRPLLYQAENPESKIIELLSAREKLYNMGYKIDTTDLTIKETVNKIYNKI